MMKERIHNLLPISLFAVLLLGFTTSPLNMFNVVVNQTEVVLTWSINDLSEVDKFEIHRKWMNGRFELIEGSVTNIDNNIRRNPPAQFEFKDTQLYKNNSADNVEYVLHIHMTNGSKFEAHRNIQYTTSTVRRTWGSIKSMFQ